MARARTVHYLPVSIRRAIGGLLVVLAAGSGLRLECLFSCGRTQAASESSTCHATANGEAALAPGAEVCLDDDGSTALAVARAAAVVTSIVPPAAVPAFATGVDRPFSSLVSVQALAPPASRPPIPLRT